MTKDVADKPLKKFKITFHGDGGDIEIIHNYRLNVYQRNIETEIDENFLHALKLATINTIVEADGKRKDVTIPTHQYTVEPI